MSRVVVDTNIFVGAAFNRRSSSASLIAALRAGEHLLVWNARTRRETESVLRRIPKISWSEMAGLFRDEGRFDGTTDPDAFRVVSDPADREFAALAAAAGCPVVSNDHHLLDHRETLGVPVLTPREFVRPGEE